MNKWNDIFHGENIFFVTPEINRAIYFDHLITDYWIVCSYFDPIIPVLRKQGNKIFCLQEELGERFSPIDNTGKLLENPLVLEYIKKISKRTPSIFYFKPSLKIDILLKQLGFNKIGNDHKLNEKFENKILAYNFLAKYFPDVNIEGETNTFANLDFQDAVKKYSLPFVLQFSHGWAGKTTYFIQSEKQFQSLQKKFPQTKVKVTKYIKGFTVLNNCCLFQQFVFVSPPAIQINGIDRLCTNPAVTCGRQWPAEFLSRFQIEAIYDISQKIGKAMREGGYIGFFGIDFLVEEQTRKIYISEINARLTASSSFYTRLEMGIGITPLIIYHMAGFLGLPVDLPRTSNQDIEGSQISLRKSSSLNVFKDTAFGVFEENNGIKKVDNTYYPEHLVSKQLIYIKNHPGKMSSTAELARIETKEKVLKDTNKLADWIAELIH